MTCFSSARLLLFAICLLLALASDGQATSTLPGGEVGAEDPQGDLAEYLVSQQLVVKGRLVSMVPLERTKIGGCGWGINGPYASWDIEVAIDSVLFGSAEDSIISFATVRRGVYAPGVFVPGREIVAWGFHNCTDGWKLYGDAIAIDDDGALIEGAAPNVRVVLKTPGGPIRPTYDLLRLRLEELGQANMSRTLVGAIGVATVHVASVTRTGDGLVATIDTTQTVYGSGSSSVTAITFTWSNGCYYDLLPGDWLLIPIGGVIGSGSVTLNACPYTYVIRDSYVRGLGVPLDQLEYALHLGEGGVVVRPILGE